MNNNGTGITEITGDSKPLVLVAEDTDSNYLLISTVLRKEYSLQRAINGEEALSMCRELSPDIILMDVRMPKMDGLEATRQIRQFNMSVPIIALTAFAFEQDRQNALNAGCDDFLTKPVSITGLKNTIIKWLKT